MAQEQVNAFVYDNRQARMTIHEQLTDMIFKNVH